jgi:TonB family protein
MNRLQKKCLIASTGCHLLLCLIVLFGSAFLSSEKKEPALPPIHFIPSHIINDALSGGGTPAASSSKPAATPAAPPAPAPRETRVVPKPEVEKSPRVPELTKSRNEQATRSPRNSSKSVKPDLKEKSNVKTSARNKIEPNLDIKRTTPQDRAAQAKAAAEAKARANAEAARLAKLNEAFAGLTSGLKESGPAVGVGVLGPGGGEAFASYRQVVERIYDEAWIRPSETTDDNSNVKVRIVVARDGRIISDDILQRSGNVSLDKSVQQALDRVRRRGLPPFPEGSKDAQRSFTINFNLLPRRQFG